MEQVEDEGRDRVKDMEQLARELERGGKGEALRQIGSSPAGKKLESMIDGAALEKALQRGDAAALKRMLGALLSTPEGKTLSDQVRGVMKE